MDFNITTKEIYDYLNSNDNILKIYMEIENKEIKEGGWAFHNFEHVTNVSKIAEKILTDLNFNEETIYKCKIACLLHDIGALQGKEGKGMQKGVLSMQESSLKIIIGYLRALKAFSMQLKIIVQDLKQII